MPLLAVHYAPPDGRRRALGGAVQQSHRSSRCGRANSPPEGTGHNRAVPANFRAEIEALRPYLLRYASLELRSREAAEDAVQETLLAALAAEASFAGRSNLRTWLTGILKHKIVDAIRRASRERPVEAHGGEAGTEDFDALFDETGHWRDQPQAWPHPEDALHERQVL